MELLSISILFGLGLYILIEKIINTLGNSNGKHKMIIFLLTDGLHNFTDGLALASFYHASILIRILFRVYFYNIYIYTRNSSLIRRF